MCLQCGRRRFDPRVGKIPWRRDWQSTPVFLSGESHGRRSLVGCIQPMGSERNRATDTLTLSRLVCCHRGRPHPPTWGSKCDPRFHPER